jgi:hypothetical protein
MLLVTQKSAMSTGLTAVADKDNVSLDTDHSGLVKYESSISSIYLIMQQRLRVIIDKDVPCVARRFHNSM